MGKVHISTGQIEGSESSGIHSFKGIPFAAPISGENRWRAPQPPASWEGVRDATQTGNICPQEKPPNKWLAGPAGKAFMETLWVTETQADDCLNLNVWTSTLDPEAKLPVMFYIHGGAFTTGSGSLPIYDGTNLALKNVVVVSINYRLAMMGAFVAPGMFDDDFCTPNRGFLDQVAGLEWVQENISNFGGDPDNVTIFGESAGGQSIAVLLASPVAQSLFKRAIAQSGTPEYGSNIVDHENFAVDLLQALNIQPGSKAALSGMTGPDTVAAMKAARKLIATGDEERYGSIIVNGNIACVYGDEFMPLSILDSLQSGVGADKDLMIGSVKEDGRLFPLVMPGPEFFAAWLCMGWFKGLMHPKNDPKTVFENYRRVMPGASKTYVRGQILTDSMFRRGTVVAAEKHSAHSPGSTYLYQFNWTSPAYNGAIGAMHGVDLPFTNQNLDVFHRVMGDIEPLREMADTVSDAWVNFARYGKPSAEKMPEWPTFNTEERATMIFDNSIELQYDVDRDIRDIWFG